MKLRDTALPDDINTLQAMLLAERQLSASKEQLINQLQQQLKQFWEQLRLMRQQRFGKSSEQHPHQADMFNEAESLADEAPEESKQTITYERGKPKRKPLPANLPREPILHDIDNKICDDCGHELHKIGEDISEKLEVVPMQLKVIQHIRPKYSCRHCEGHDIKVHIQQQKMPPSVIDKSYATPSLLSFIITNKFQYSLPLYRQEKLFSQYGIDLSRKTQSEWVLKCAERLKPVYQQLRQHLLKQAVIHADETRLTVNDVDKSQCYMWIYCCGADSPSSKENAPPNIVLFDYQQSRSAQCAIDFLDGYRGYLQVDGYKAYEKTQATLVGCWAHARRKFDEAIKSQPKGKAGKASQGISFAQKLYAVEKRMKLLSADKKYQIRQQEALPLVEQFKAWLDKSANQVLPKSKVGEAISYCLNQWHKLTRYLDDGRLNIDNNRAEREAKHFAVGRKNWLFAHTERGANSSAVLYSIVETCKANGININDYLNFALTEVAYDPKDLEYLMPWNFKNS